MVIQREMELRRAGYVVVYVTLLCALAIASSEGRRKTVEMVLANAANCHFTSLELNADTGEKACMKELAEKEYEAEGFVPCIPVENMGKEAIRILPPDMKHDLLDCLRKKTMLSRGSEPSPGLFDRFSKPIELFFSGGSNIHTRHVIRESQDSSEPNPAEAPSPAPSPSPSPSPEAESPADSPLPSPSHAPTPSPSHAPPKSPSQNLHPPVEAPAPSQEPPADDSDVSDLPTPSVVRSPPPPRASPKSRSPKKHEDNQAAIIAGIVAAGAGVVLVVALLLFCCRRGEKSKVDPKDGQKDERPLLNISLSELSAGKVL